MKPLCTCREEDGGLPHFPGCVGCFNTRSGVPRKDGKPRWKRVK